MLLILTHENADFDAVGSQVAAHKLYPEGVPLLSQRLNRNVEQFLTLYWDVLPFVRREEWRRQRIKRVLLVDTHSLNSVRGLVRQPEVQVIDHHVFHQQRPSWTYQVEAVGATVTLMVERLQDAGLVLTAEEATVLLLGIYEDTGSLVYDTTTSRDVHAAGWLLDQGAQLAVVRQFMNIPLTPQQRDLYQALHTAVQWTTIHGQPIVVTTATAPPDFEDEISSITHRLREALSPTGLIVLVQISDDVQLVARSTNDYVNVAAIAKALGGGGHNRAAAALIVGQSVESVQEEVMALLPRAIKPMTSVAQIMSRGVRTLPPTMPIAEAAILMQRLGYEGYPVVARDKKELLGLLTRRAVDRAVNHDLGQAPISRIMRAGQVTVRPSDSIERVQQLMLTEGWGQIPVVSENSTDASHPIGIVTRTDVLNSLFKPTPETSETNLRQLLHETLPPALWAITAIISDTADKLHMPLYFVGGPVRDLLLGHTPVDLDMVVEGDAIQLARHLKQTYGGDIHTHARFGTAKWFLTPDIWSAIQEQTSLDIPSNAHALPLPASIDFVTARTEFYAEPSALPQVEQGSIKLDLHRRDFTINTLAVRLDGAHLGQLLDFYGGQRDLQQGVIRVLHSLSFIDDPTRILRAIRLEQRLDFEIEPRTAELIKAALPMMDRVTGERIRHEIELALSESNPLPIMSRLAEFNVLAHIHPALTWLPETAAFFAQVPSLLDHPQWGSVLRPDSTPFVYFALWLMPFSPEVKKALMNRLRVRKATRQDIKQSTQLLQVLQKLPTDARPSQVEKALRPFRPRVMWVVRVILADTPSAALLDRYYHEWRPIKTAVSGDDIRALGLKPSRQYALILDQILAARLDGKVTNEAQERAMLDTLVQEGKEIS